MKAKFDFLPKNWCYKIMWRIVYINDGYAIMNLLSEETAGWYEFKSDAKEAFESMRKNGEF